VDNDEDLTQERPRPKVVDKRISARSAEPPAADPEPAPPAEAEPAEPDTPDPQVASPVEAQPTPVSEDAPQGEPLPSDPNLWTPEQEAEARRLAQEVAQTPSLEWVVNVAVTLANVAGTKLDLGATADAQLAIDALAAIVERLGPRLDATEAPLRQTLAQLQLAFAERAATPPGT
jgi:hypothetical protein